MDTKLKLKNDILVGMKQYLDMMTMAILESVIVQSIQNFDIKMLLESTIRLNLMIIL